MERLDSPTFEYAIMNTCSWVTLTLFDTHRLRDCKLFHTALTQFLRKQEEARAQRLAA